MGEREWTVYPLDGDPHTESLRSYDNQAAAWHHAVWHPLHAEDVLPLATPERTIFVDSRVSRGYTADPRHAEKVEASVYGGEHREELDRLITAFIQSRINDPAYMAIYGEEDPMTDETTETETPETPQEPQGGTAEAPAADDGATTQPDPSEAAREALSDSDRNAYDNFSTLAESASSDQGRDFWRSKAEEVLANGS